jgi:hypothetical protein
MYQDIKIDYDISEGLSELEIEPKFPMKLKLSNYYFVNKKISDSKTIELNVLYL